jgi:hypothetical protein
MLLRETSDVYCENHTEHTNTLRGQNAEFLYAKEGGIYSNHSSLNNKGKESTRSADYTVMCHELV